MPAACAMSGRATGCGPAHISHRRERALCHSTALLAVLIEQFPGAPTLQAVTQVSDRLPEFAFSNSEGAGTLTVGPSFVASRASAINEATYVLMGTCPFTTTAPPTTSTLRVQGSPTVLSGWPASCTVTETVYLTGSTTSGSITSAVRD